MNTETKQRIIIFCTGIPLAGTLLVAALVVCAGCATFPPKQFSASIGQRFYRDVTLVSASETNILIRRSSDTVSITIPKDGKAHPIGQLEAIRILQTEKDKQADVVVSSIRQFGPITIPPD